jgi:hypothetical protein
MTRPTGIEAIKDTWFKKFKKIEIGCDEDKLDPEIFNNLRDYRGVSTLKKAAMNILVKMIDSKDLEKLRDQFLAIDKDGTGMITAPELKKVLSEGSVHIPE